MWGLEFSSPVPPAHAFSADKGLSFTCAADTDAWARTHYGFVRDNVHFAGAKVTGDFVMTVSVSGLPQSRYDQAGLMVKCSPSCWLKASAEYIPDGPSHLGSVVTNSGYSDWATQDVDSGALAAGGWLHWRIRREGSDYIVEVRRDTHAPWSQLRMAHLLEDMSPSGGPAPAASSGADAGSSSSSSSSGGSGGYAVLAGLYACSPCVGAEHKAPYQVTFADFSIKPGRI